MLAIKLKLIGKKGQHSFRMIIQEKRAKLEGKFVDDLGWYNPHANQVKIDQEKLKKWLANGAQPTESAQSVIGKSNDLSEVQSYEGRKSPKKKKKEKNPQPQPKADEPLAQVSAEETKAEIPIEDESAPSVEDSQPVPEEAPVESVEAKTDEVGSPEEEKQAKAVELNASSVAQEDSSPDTSS
ncbi:MAG: 30S ribosomal protein S16 [Patescibacteria group bacterium]